ncbi:membrane protein [Rhodococcus phage Trogglehumper]|uniref:Membrane protein n=1 Tax=Rhodococcus phage Trogglehumper TaxID=3038381 RepID=A0AAF0GN18_9CAUD|nr:membrane protein [Rhodococcus phage Trogglehumper]
MTVPRPMVHPEDAQEDIRLTTVLLGVFAVGIGASTLLGGEGRWADDIYKFALSVPGSPESWGVPILFVGTLILAAFVGNHPRTLALGLFLGGAWFVFMGYSFAAAFFESSEVSPMATGFAWMFAILYLQKAWVQWSGRKINSVVWLAHKGDGNAEHTPPGT